MAAATTDNFMKLGGTSSLVNTPKVTSVRSAAGTTLAVDNCNWDQTTGKIFATYQIDTSGNVISGTEIIWVGIVTGTTSIGSLTRLAGATDTGSAIGDIVELLPASLWANRVVGGILTQHNQDGTHAAVTATSLATTAAVTAGNGLTVSAGTVTLPNNTITANELSTSAITLGYTQITTGFSTASTSSVLATGLTASVTIPAGGRRVKITAFTDILVNSGSGQVTTMEIWDGTVGSGTKLSQAQTYSAAAATGEPAIAMAVHTPSAGAKTYNIGLKVTAGTGTIDAAATYPAFILVEAI